jgi:hypothetical protein
VGDIGVALFMKIWIKVVLYFLLSLIIMVLPMALYSFTETHSQWYFVGAFLLSALVALKLGKVF